MTAFENPPCRLCASTRITFQDGRCAYCIVDDHKAKSTGATAGPFYVSKDNDWTFTVRDFITNALVGRFTVRYHGTTCVINAEQAEANAHRFAASL